MISYKSDQEIELMRKSAELLSRTMGEIAKYVKPGVTTNQLDKIAYEYITEHGGFPSCKEYNGYRASIGASVNDAVVHGLPTDTPLKNGDIVTIDACVQLNGFHSDMAYTFPVGKISSDKQRLIDVTHKAMDYGIAEAVSGKRTGDIGSVIESYVDHKGYSVPRGVVGHGIGRELHEEPEVPNWGDEDTGTRLQERMVICVEPMVNMGSKETYTDPDGFTIRTLDKSPAAHFEQTVLIRKGRPEVLTTYKYIEESLKKRR